MYHGVHTARCADDAASSECQSLPVYVVVSAAPILTCINAAAQLAHELLVDELG